MKLWDKGVEVEKKIESFTIGRDKEFDLYLAEHDVIGSIAHIIMLEKIGLLTSDELIVLKKELINIYNTAKNGAFYIEEGIEDVHSQVELLLTKKLGDIGKKIHSGRSRNDQVLVDLKLYMRKEIYEISQLLIKLFNSFISQSEKYKNVIIPGYTHLQVAMPSSFGLWFGAYAESLSDDLQLLLSAYLINNQNPLGSGAGYGSSFPLDRQLTTDLLGFNNPNVNSVYAQMSRGKSEKIVSFAISTIAATLSKFATDACLYMNQNFAFIGLPDNLTTGSSIMPHKKNPDVFELIRGKCNKLQSVSNEILIITNNLPSGYFRDMQIIKESIFPAFSELKTCLEITNHITNNIIINNDIIDDEKYKYLFSVENVNTEVLNGVAFRDAYKKIAKEIQTGTYKPQKEINHTHLGSIGNLSNNLIEEKIEKIYNQFNFKQIDSKINTLIK